jgi:Skp family chaperone for outer membrane proteins
LGVPKHASAILYGAISCHENQRNHGETNLSKKPSRSAPKGNLDMMSRSKALSLVVCALVVMGWQRGLCDGPQQPRIAVVDVERIEKEYKDLRAKQEELDASRARSAGILEEVSQYTFLSAELFKEIVAIASLPKPWPEDKAKRAEELKKISEEKEKEFLALRANTARTAEEEDRFKTLQELVQTREGDLRQLENSFLQDLLNRQRELQTQLLGRVRETIAQVAKEKKYDFVFDSAVVFFGGDDITSDVLNALNKAEPASQEKPKSGE